MDENQNNLSSIDYKIANQSKLIMLAKQTFAKLEYADTFFEEKGYAVSTLFNILEKNNDALFFCLRNWKQSTKAIQENLPDKDTDKREALLKRLLEILNKHFGQEKKSLEQSNGNIGRAKLYELIGDQLLNPIDKFDAYNQALYGIKPQYKNSNGKITDSSHYQNITAKKKDIFNQIQELFKKDRLYEFWQLHHPETTADLWFKFNSEPLKYIFHSCEGLLFYGKDENGEDGLLEKMRKYMLDFIKNHPEVPASLYQQLNGLLFGVGEWLDLNGEKHQENYTHKKWVEWMASAPKKNPFDNEAFTKTLVTFRASVRFKYDTGKPVKMFLKEHFKEDMGMIDISDKTVTSMYIDAIGFKKIFSEILRMCKKARENSAEDKKLQVVATCAERENSPYQIFTITVTDPYSANNLFDRGKYTKLCEGGGDLGSIAKQCVGYFDFAFETRFKDNDGQISNKRITVLPAPLNPKEMAAEKCENPNGFKYIFTFYNCNSNNKS